jgi:hypothetical protein
MRAGILLLFAACTSPVTGNGSSLHEAAAATENAFAGINLPPTQGTSNAGAFQSGVYTWNYTDAQIATASTTFDTVRLPINIDTANDPASLAIMQSYVDRFDGQAIICFFGTADATTGTHGTGKVDDIDAAASAWANIDAVFGSYPGVHYEILNEPFGYENNIDSYMSDMLTVIDQAGLSPDKCILDGMGYADDIQTVANAGWTGDLGYHFYPNWSSDHSQSGYSNLAQNAIGSLGPRTWITEFGADLGYANNCYDTYVDASDPSAANVNSLRGLNDALSALRAEGNGVRGAVSYHGWDNGDSYDFWLSNNAQGACKVREIETSD